MPVLLANYQANIVAAQAFKCRMFLEQNKKNIFDNNNILLRENKCKKQKITQISISDITMSSTSSTSSSKFKLSTDAINEEINFFEQRKQAQMLLFQQQHHQLMLQQQLAHVANTPLQHFNNFNATTSTPTVPSNNSNAFAAAAATQFFHGNNLQHLMSTITPQQQQHLQQVYSNFYGSMLPQQLENFVSSQSRATMPIYPEDLALTNLVATTATTTTANTIPNVKSKLEKPDLTVRIQQSSSPLPTLTHSLNATNLEGTIATPTTTTPSLVTATKQQSNYDTNHHSIFNLPLDPQYQLHQQLQHQQQQQNEPVLLFAAHNETAHAIDSSKLPSAIITTTSTNKTTNIPFTNTITTTTTSTTTNTTVATMVLTATPPAVQALPANCREKPELYNLKQSSENFSKFFTEEDCLLDFIKKILLIHVWRC